MIFRNLLRHAFSKENLNFINFIILGERRNRMGEAQQSNVSIVIQKVHFGSLANEETVHKLQVLTICFI